MPRQSQLKQEIRPSLSTNEKQSCTRNLSCAFRKLQVIAGNSVWLIALFASIVIGRSNYFCIGFSTVLKSALF